MYWRYQQQEPTSNLSEKQCEVEIERSKEKQKEIERQESEELAKIERERKADLIKGIVIVVSLIAVTIIGTTGILIAEI